jgi:hypothetical protein
VPIFAFRATYASPSLGAIDYVFRSTRSGWDYRAFPDDRVAQRFEVRTLAELVATKPLAPFSP